MTVCCTATSTDLLRWLRVAMLKADSSRLACGHLYALVCSKSSVCYGSSCEALQRRSSPSTMRLLHIEPTGWVFAVPYAWGKCRSVTCQWSKWKQVAVPRERLRAAETVCQFVQNIGSQCNSCAGFCRGKSR